MANAAGNGVQNPVNEIVELLQAELDELLQQKASIRLHMRNLRRRLSVLQPKRNDRRAARPSRGLNGRALQPEKPTNRHLHGGLARACRIAFLELGGTATPDELYAAILRRASFSFVSIEGNPTAAVIRTLESMAQFGGVVRGPNSRWTYDPDARTLE